MTEDAREWGWNFQAINLAFQTKEREKPTIYTCGLIHTYTYIFFVVKAGPGPSVLGFKLDLLWQTVAAGASKKSEGPNLPSNVKV